jgi:Spy/CpxP family protein refolding chaperone
MRAGHETMADLMHAETIDEAAIRGVAEEIAAAQVELMVAHARAMVEMRQVLTPEQLEQFLQMRRQYPQMSGMKGGHGHGFRHGAGQSAPPVEDAGADDGQ